MSLGMEEGLSLGDFVLDGDSYCDFVRTLHNAQSLLVC